MAFDNRDYEPVKARKKRFYETFPKGRITVVLCNPESVMEYALMEARVYTEESQHGLPRGIGYALEIRDTELQTANNGKKYESVNYTSWVENAEESAVGRALDNAGFASNMHCSAEEMAKAERMKQKLAQAPAKASVPPQATTEAPKAVSTADIESIRANIHSTVLAKKIPGAKIKAMIAFRFAPKTKLAELDIKECATLLEEINNL